jgi:hypothetical protein
VSHETIYSGLGWILLSAVIAVSWRPRGTLQWFAWSVLPIVVLGLFLVWDGFRVSIGPPSLGDLVELVLLPAAL